MTDPRLKVIASAAAARGWSAEFVDTPHRTELVVVPTVSNPEQQGYMGMGFGITLGGQSIAMWCWESWAGSLFEPDLQKPVGLDYELDRFPRVRSLEDALLIFDNASRRYLAEMRGLDPEEPSAWSDLEPLAGGAA
ncbi:hypothetical protein [Synechococcus sp. ROS8604]|uniref:hypothetical protein n=1 Tax=Synechococcus sp. ROS8604 TaxID=1442557 RepID=UPI001648E3EE|nr:hypothetical protein [Synechococcus sp. ROS8604]QNI89556.1 hypothetical protein SynROS8604_02940 [Synechococcus sp. ROS8604]